MRVIHSAPYITSPVALYHSRINDWYGSLSDGLFHIIVMAFLLSRGPCVNNQVRRWKTNTNRLHRNSLLCNSISNLSSLCGSRQDGLVYAPLSCQP